MIAGLLLAAGHSRRFGADKLLAPLGGRPVLEWSARAMLAALDVAYAVLPPDHPAASALRAMGMHVVEHAGREAGMASSIAAGVIALPADARAVIIALGDQPLVSPAVFTVLRERWHQTGAMAVAPRYRDGRGHPVLFDRACFPALAHLDGDTGARAVLESLGEDVSLVDVDEHMPLDVDTPEALERVRRAMGDVPVSS